MEETAAIQTRQAAAHSGPTVVPPRVDARAHANLPPAYPYRSRRFGEEGTVMLAVRISDTGRVEAVSVKQSSGHRRLDRAALRAVKGWRYQPATRGGDPIAYDYLQPVVFKLAD
jgi:protein TonB